MKRSRRSWTPTVLAALLAAGVQTTSAQEKPKECDSCERASWPALETLPEPERPPGTPDPRTKGPLRPEQMQDVSNGGGKGVHDNGRGGNSFANDPCLDPAPGSAAVFPTNFFGTVQSETELAVLNSRGSMGKKIVVGYNDSLGFYDNREGLSGYAYSTNGGNTFIDAGGLPPRVPSGAPAGTLGSDAYFGDPVIVVHHRTETFFYASIYMNPLGLFTLSVNRGRFVDAPPRPTQPTESRSNTKCLNDPTLVGIPDEPSTRGERILWEPPVEAVVPPFLGGNNDDFLDKEWLYLDQRTGTLFLTYTRFEPDGSTPIELVRCLGCANNPTGPLVFTPPTVIVPNEAAEFNQATQAYSTPSGRLIVTWHAREFLPPDFPEVAQRIEYAYSDNPEAPIPVFSPEQLVAVVNPQGEPAGYNRARPTILNAPYIIVDAGSDDGVHTDQERSRRGFGNVYITYFSGKTPLGSVTRAADIFVSASSTNGTSFGPPVKVNDDVTNTTHVFPSVQANKHGDVYVAWIDRREDPAPFVLPNTGGNILNNTWAAVSRDFGATFGHNKVQSDVATSWFTREDARPDYGDYNSSDLLGFNQFVTTWADGRFPPGAAVITTSGIPRLVATPDTIFTIANGLGIGGGSK